MRFRRQQIVRNTTDPERFQTDNSLRFGQSYDRITTRSGTETDVRFNWKVILGLSALATAAASVLGTVAANQNRDHFADDEYVQLGLQDVIPGDGEFPLPGAEFKIDLGSPSTVDTPPSFTKVYRVRPQSYAEEFSKDKNVGKTPDIATDVRILDKITTTIENYTTGGFNIEKIDIIGMASAEDDSPDVNAGIDKPSKLNQQLAETRARLTKTALINELKNSGLSEDLIDSLNIQAIVGEEVTSQEIVDAIINEAHRVGMTPRHMIELYNNENPDDVLSDKTIKLLDTQLATNRGTKVVVYAKYNNPPTTCGTCDLRLVIIPIIIPWFRIRRRRYEESETEHIDTISEGQEYCRIVNDRIATIRVTNVTTDNVSYIVTYDPIKFPNQQTHNVTESRARFVEKYQTAQMYPLA